MPGSSAPRLRRLGPLGALVAAGIVLAMAPETRPLAAQNHAQTRDATDADRVVIDDMIFQPDQLGPSGPLATSVFSVFTLPWPGGVIPIAFDASVSDGQRTQFIRNCNLWGTRVPGVGCATRTVEPVALNVYNRSLPFSGGQSTVGYHATARRELTITPNAWFDSLILHEVGHAFGFMHEHQRADRDTYVTIDTTNILPGYAGNFAALNAASSQVYGPYDFRSIMHYYPNSFAVDPSRPNIIARPPYQAFQSVMGRATTLSDLDLGGIVAVYGVPPDTPVDLTASLGAGTAGLAWRQPGTGGRPAFFEVAVGTAPGASDLGRFNVGPATSVSGAVPPGTYYARVTAVNERAASAASAELPFTVTPTAPPPGTPRDFTVSAAGSLLTLSWRPAQVGGAVGTYVVQAGSASGLSDIHDGPVGPVTSLTAAVPLRTYFIRVLAQNAVGTSGASNEIRVDVTSHCVVPAGPVLAATRSGNVVSATWTTPAGGPLSHYVLQAGRSPGGADLFDAPVGLTPGASGTLASGIYYIRVAAVAACGTGPWSNETAVQVP